MFVREKMMQQCLAWSKDFPMSDGTILFSSGDIDVRGAQRR